MLVNLTNDAWYWGSSELDMHLASGVFRAVEMRTPLVIAANRGLSAHIDHLGRIVAVTERRRAGVVVANVQLPAPAVAIPEPLRRLRRLVRARLFGMLHGPGGYRLARGRMGRG